MLWVACAPSGRGFYFQHSADEELPLRVLSAHTARHNVARSCRVVGFSSGKELLKKSHAGADGHLQFCIFTNSTIVFSFEQVQSRNTVIMFPKTKPIILYSTYMEYEIVKIKADTSTVGSIAFF